MGKKFYVVWKGKETGIFHSWDECKVNVIGYNGAKYKSFPTEQEAKKAYQAGEPSYERKKTKKETSVSKQNTLLSDSKTGNYITESISVDAACSGNPGKMEYQGVYTKNGEQIFHFGPVENGTNNIGEFIGIVHALALLKKKGSNLPIYSDSLTAISWVRKKQVNTNIPRNESTKELWEVIDRALKWLHSNSYPNEILKWETKKWGEIKADFGRK